MSLSQKPAVIRRPGRRVAASRRTPPVLLVLPCAPVVPSNRRVRTGGGLVVSLLIHAGIVVIAWLIVVRAAGRDPELVEGEEGVPGDDSPPVFVHHTPRPKAPPKETVPEVIPETPRRLVSAVPSPVVLPAAAPPVPVPAAIPAVAVVPEKTGSVSQTAAKSPARHRSGSKGTGEKGRGRLSSGSGSGTAAPTSPRLLTQIAPEFPASARRRGAHGVAWVRVQVSAAGSVAEASLHRSCGHAVMRISMPLLSAPQSAGTLRQPLPEDVPSAPLRS